MSTNGCEEMTSSDVDRSIELSRIIRRRADIAQKDLIENYTSSVSYCPLTEYMISQVAWDHISSSEIDPKLVFAHPDILISHPTTSLYYRGLSLLSLKRVGNLAVPVASWEDGTRSIAVSYEAALKVARVYNSVISSVVEMSTDWTLKNGYRNIISTMAIGLDGVIRNQIGVIAEREVQKKILSWLRDNGLVKHEDSKKREYCLSEDVVMRYSSEPDIEFRKDGIQIATIEIKGGRDPAGALERLAAAQKSFRETPGECKNFLIAGVITQEMGNRLDDIVNVKYYELDDILEKESSWNEFSKELFHYAIRIN